MSESDIGGTAALARFASRLRFEDLDQTVISRTGELFLDWIGSAVGGRFAEPTRILGEFSAAMGPAAGRSEWVTTQRGTSAFFAALVNGASSHVLEQDDLHAGSVLHLGTVVFPAALAVAQEEGSSGREFVAAVVAGYEVGARAGRYLGRTHYEVFHTTGTAGTLAAAAAASRLLGGGEEAMINALGSAGTQAAGLWEFLRDGAHSKQLHSGKAAANGVLSAWTAWHGLTGPRRVLEGPQGMGAGMSRGPHPEELDGELGQSWAVMETSLKLHACCRHTHPSADALAVAMETHHLKADDIRSVKAFVHQAAIDVLGPVVDPQSPHQARFCMGFVLALIATHGRAGVEDFDLLLHDPAIRRFMTKVEMVYDAEVDAAYPERWEGSVQIEAINGDLVVQRVHCPRGDPTWPLDEAQMLSKVERLVRLGGGTAERLSDVVPRVRMLSEEPDLSAVLGPLCPELANRR